MNLRQFTKQDPEVNLTSLIDVVFLLLIFFMVSTTFTKESEITVDLPEANVEPVEAAIAPIDLTIDVKGHFYINQQKVVNRQTATLKKAIQLAVDGRKDVSLVISADANTPHQAVVTAMDAARQLGIVKLSLATKQPKE
ncbi:Biopolymer transport protein ExbD/TolR [hydrothermal vent metagenome]|uniref:Biopolymer transport protein ExbD/TolR n=1 Tax=hydrothermal vent metagenome TaxID=652676 RepID=A0A3B1A323_9ZZZZ